MIDEITHFVNWLPPLSLMALALPRPVLSRVEGWSLCR